MPMTLYFKRAKNFVQSDDNGTKKFLAQPGPTPQNVPFWVANTPTFKQGIKDGSIVNLTPPEQMPGYKPAPVAVVEEEPEAPAAPVVPEDEELEQHEVPQAAFGGQPMTPVPPAVRIGGITPAARRGK